MKTALTKNEARYIADMFGDDITNICQLPVGCIVLFMENREQASKHKWPLDHSITEKFLSCWGLPLNLTEIEFKKTYRKRLERMQKNLV